MAINDDARPVVCSHHAIVDPQQPDPNETLRNRGAPATFYTPVQSPPAGTALSPQPDGKPIPKLFQPLQLRDLTLQNRIFLSPMCQYSADDGHHTDWHFAHLGGIIIRGPGLAMVEATSVTPEGRITPEDSGIWKDSQIQPFKRTVDFAHSQGQKIGIQLGHAGRKASTVAPWLSPGAIATADVGGWSDNVYGPSNVSWNEKHASPKEMSLKDIDDFKVAWSAGVKRSIAAGFDVVEIHAAHGYLFSSFLSPVADQRTDQYGGSFENRIRLLLETVEITRKIIPSGMPLFVRVNGTDYLEEELPNVPSWRVEDSARLALILADKGVDFLDVSGGGNHPKQHPHVGPGYQAPYAKKIKEAVGDKLAVGTVGAIGSGQLAQELVEDGLDAVLVGRPFLKNPFLVWQFAEELGVQIQLANQIRWGFGGRKGGPRK